MLSLAGIPVKGPLAEAGDLPSRHGLWGGSAGDVKVRGWFEQLPEERSNSCGWILFLQPAVKLFFNV